MATKSRIHQYIAGGRVFWFTLALILNISKGALPVGLAYLEAGAGRVAKNILAGHGNSIPFLAVSTLFHGLIFIVPWLWWLGSGDLWPLMLALVGLIYAA